MPHVRRCLRWRQLLPLASSQPKTDLRPSPSRAARALADRTSPARTVARRQSAPRQTPMMTKEAGRRAACRCHDHPRRHMSHLRRGRGPRWRPCELQRPILRRRRRRWTRLRRRRPFQKRQPAAAAAAAVAVAAEEEEPRRRGARPACCSLCRRRRSPHPPPQALPSATSTRCRRRRRCPSRRRLWPTCPPSMPSVSRERSAPMAQAPSRGRPPRSCCGRSRAQRSSFSTATAGPAHHGSGSSPPIARPSPLSRRQ